MEKPVPKQIILVFEHIQRATNEYTRVKSTRQISRQHSPSSQSSFEYNMKSTISRYSVYCNRVGGGAEIQRFFIFSPQTTNEEKKYILFCRCFLCVYQLQCAFSVRNSGINNSLRQMWKNNEDNFLRMRFVIKQNEKLTNFLWKNDSFESFTTIFFITE